MKDFILKFSIFSLTFILAIVSLNYFFAYFNSTNNIDSINHHSEIVFFGNSRVACSVDPSVINNSLNISSHGETFFYTYQKAKALIKSNNKIKTAFIQLSPTELAFIKEKNIWDDNHLMRFFPVYLSLFSIDEQFYLLRKNPKKVFECYFVKALLKNSNCCGFANITCNHNFWGGYKGMDRVMPPEEEKKYKTEKSFKLYSYNLSFLAKTISLLNKSNIDVVFISIPTLANYSSKLKNDFTVLRKKNFPKNDYLDFNRIDFAKDHFVDGGHLNKVGAKKLSMLLNEMINNGLLKSTDKELFFAKHNNL
jgi:hypothetical protein